VTSTATVEEIFEDSGELYWTCQSSSCSLGDDEHPIDTRNFEAMSMIKHKWVVLNVLKLILLLSWKWVSRPSAINKLDLKLI
jgi:hypothetical protein